MAVYHPRIKSTRNQGDDFEMTMNRGARYFFQSGHFYNDGSSAGILTEDGKLLYGEEENGYILQE